MRPHRDTLALGPRQRWECSGRMEETRSSVAGVARGFFFDAKLDAAPLRVVCPHAVRPRLHRDCRCPAFRQHDLFPRDVAAVAISEPKRPETPLEPDREGV